MKKRISKSGVICVTLIYSLTNCLLAYAPEANFWKDRQKSMQILDSKFQNFHPKPEIQHSKSDVAIFHIQDIHANQEAQKQIGQTIADLIKKGEVDLIALEGSTRKINLDSFQKFPYQKSVKKVADQLLADNKISGPINALLHLSHIRHPAIVGIDDPDHYQANIEAYKTAALQAPDMKIELEKQTLLFNQRKKEIFNTPLLEFDQHVEKHRQGTLAFGAYLQTLIKYQTVHLQHPTIDKFLNALALENALDFKRVESERTRLIEHLAPKLTSNEMKIFTDYRSARISHARFYSELKKFCAAKALNISQYPALNSYISYIILSDQIDGETLFKEAREVEENIYAQLTQKPEEKELLVASRRLYLTKKLADFALTKEEWDEYKIINPSPLGGRGGLDLLSFEKFYRQAEIRDQKMAENVAKAITQYKAKKIVLVTGGFHSQGISKKLGNAFTYAPFVPRITKLDTTNGTAYLSVFTQEKTPLEKLFEGQKLFLAFDPFSPAMEKVAKALIIKDAHRNEARDVPIRVLSKNVGLKNSEALAAAWIDHPIYRKWFAWWMEPAVSIGIPLFLKMTAWAQGDPVYLTTMTVLIFWLPHAFRKALLNPAVLTMSAAYGLFALNLFLQEGVEWNNLLILPLMGLHFFIDNPREKIMGEKKIGPLDIEAIREYRGNYAAITNFILEPEQNSLLTADIRMFIGLATFELINNARSINNYEDILFNIRLVQKRNSRKLVLTITNPEEIKLEYIHSRLNKLSDLLHHVKKDLESKDAARLGQYFKFFDVRRDKLLKTIERVDQAKQIPADQFTWEIAKPLLLSPFFTTDIARFQAIYLSGIQNNPKQKDHDVVGYGLYRIDRDVKEIEGASFDLSSGDGRTTATLEIPLNNPIQVNNRPTSAVFMLAILPFDVPTFIQIGFSLWALALLFKYVRSSNHKSLIGPQYAMIFTFLTEGILQGIAAATYKTWAPALLEFAGWTLPSQSVTLVGAAYFLWIAFTAATYLFGIYEPLDREKPYDNYATINIVDRKGPWSNFIRAYFSTLFSSSAAALITFAGAANEWKGIVLLGVAINLVMLSLNANYQRNPHDPLIPSRLRRWFADKIHPERRLQIALLGHEMEHYKRLAYTDALTGVYNLRKLEEDFPKGTANEGHTFIFFDLNNFKHVNKIVGDFKGDEVLRHYAKIVVQVAEEYGFDHVYRKGGDEFVMEVPSKKAVEIEEAVRNRFGKFKLALVRIKNVGLPHSNGQPSGDYKTLTDFATEYKASGAFEQKSPDEYGFFAQISYKEKNENDEWVEKIFPADKLLPTLEDTFNNHIDVPTSFVISVSGGISASLKEAGKIVQKKKNSDKTIETVEALPLIYFWDYIVRWMAKKDRPILLIIPLLIAMFIVEELLFGHVFINLLTGPVHQVLSERGFTFFADPYTVRVLLYILSNLFFGFRHTYLVFREGGQMTVGRRATFWEKTTFAFQGALFRAGFLFPQLDNGFSVILAAALHILYATWIAPKWDKPLPLIVGHVPPVVNHGLNEFAANQYRLRELALEQSSTRVLDKDIVMPIENESDQALYEKLSARYPERKIIPLTNLISRQEAHRFIDLDRSEAAVQRLINEGQIQEGNFYFGLPQDVLVDAAQAQLYQRRFGLLNRTTFMILEILAPITAPQLIENAIRAHAQTRDDA